MRLSLADSERVERGVHQRLQKHLQASAYDTISLTTIDHQFLNASALAGSQARASWMSATRAPRWLSMVVLLQHHMLVPPPEGVPRCGPVGESDAILSLRLEVARLAPLNVPVLLRGESGTGKELIVGALHDGGPHSNRPFVAVNMATLSPALAAAELFGAARGAFTGADRRKIGLFQSAQGGTLFLDEIGETPVEVQAMLLRALESQEILPVGSTELRLRGAMRRIMLCAQRRR